MVSTYLSILLDTQTQDHKLTTYLGLTLRVGPNMVIFNELDSFKQIYGPNPNLVKSTRYAAVSASHTPNLVSDNHQPTVNMKRKAHLDMWNNRSLKEAEPRLHALIATFLSLMNPGGDDATAASNTWSKMVNLSELGTYFGYDTMLTMGTGENPNIMLSPDKQWMPGASLYVSWRAITVRVIHCGRKQTTEKLTLYLPGLFPAQTPPMESRQDDPRASVQANHESWEILLERDQRPGRARDHWIAGPDGCDDADEGRKTRLGVQYQGALAGGVPVGRCW